MKIRLTEALEERFEEAEEYNEATRDFLTMIERHYSDGLMKKGFDVRFDSIKIYNRAKGSNTIISVLRSNLNFKIGLDDPNKLEVQHDNN